MEEFKTVADALPSPRGPQPDILVEPRATPATDDTSERNPLARGPSETASDSSLMGSPEVSPAMSRLNKQFSRDSADGSRSNIGPAPNAEYLPFNPVCEATESENSEGSDSVQKFKRFSQDEIILLLTTIERRGKIFLPKHPKSTVPAKKKVKVGGKGVYFWEMILEHVAKEARIQK